VANYDEFVVLANELLFESGTLVTLQQFGTLADDPTKPWKGSEQTDLAMEYKNVSAVFVPIIGKDLGIVVNDKELLKRTKQVAIVAPIAEGLEDKITKIKDLSGVTWKVVWAQCLRPAEQTILYYFGVER
jgi:hypothetical protein